MKRTAKLQVIAFIFYCSMPMVKANEITMVSVDWPPFYGSELKNNGVITVIVKTAFERVGHNASIKFVPWQRSMKLVEYGQYDLLMGGYYTEERSRKYLYSDPFFEIKVGLVALKSLDIKDYSTLQDLKPYTIGISRGWANNIEFDAAEYLKKEPATNQILNVRKLFKHRIDMISISFEAFRYEVAAMAEHSIDDVTFIQPPLNISNLHLLAPLSTPSRALIISDFNQGLAEIKQDGTYEQILKEYGF